MFVEATDKAAFSDCDLNAHHFLAHHFSSEKLLLEPFHFEYCFSRINSREHKQIYISLFKWFLIVWLKIKN